MLGVNTPALPASLRRTNQRTVISLLLRLGSASRADLAKAAGISQPTAGKITSDLLNLGILQEAGSNGGNGGEHRQGSKLGRPGQMLRLDDSRKRFLAIELGVAETCISALPVAVKLEDAWDYSFATPRTPEGWLKELSRLEPRFSKHDLWGVLVSVPGIVDEAQGRVLFSPNLHWLEKTDLPALLRGVWDLPVLLVQEIRALALGHLTADPKGEDFFLVDFGQGVGGAIVQDGQLYDNPVPLSGEIGHTPVAGNWRLCGCGARGCLETLVSERGLLDSLAAVERGPAPDMKRLVRHVTEKGIQPWLDDTLTATSSVIAGALNVLGIRQVVLTGRLLELPGCAERVGELVTEGAMWGRFGQIACQGAPHRRAAGLVAAGLDRLVLPEREDRRLAVGSAR